MLAYPGAQANPVRHVQRHLSVTPPPSRSPRPPAGPRPAGESVATAPWPASAAAAPFAAGASRPALVLDTNVLLDWWVFRDPRVAAVARAVEHGAVRWLACARMRDEFAHQLARPQLARWAPDAAAALAAMDALAEMRPPPAILRPAPAPRCRDPDDQVFVDLALDAGARWLLTQDRDLLALARRGAARGLAILPPQRWPGVGPAAGPQAAATGPAPPAAPSR